MKIEDKIAEQVIGSNDGAEKASWWNHQPVRLFLGYLVALTLAFIGPLRELLEYSLGEEMHSHIVLVPAISIYLAWQHLTQLPAPKGHFLAGTAVLLIAGLISFFLPGMLGMELSFNDNLARLAACYAFLIGAGGCFFLGRVWMTGLAFPFVFLLFLIPLPDAAVYEIELMLMKVTAVVAHWMFLLSDTPVHKFGQFLELPNIKLEVASECSGIRSTWVLFITSLIASHLFLKNRTHRILLVAAVLPLGILRNGVRVLVIGLLCVHKGPHMIDSWIHHQGGPVFFAISLIPLFLMALWFRWLETRSKVTKNEGDLEPKIGQTSSH